MEEQRTSEQKAEKPTQRELSDFVNQEVYYCQSSLVDMLLQKGIFDYSEVVQGTPDNQDEIDELQSKLDELEDNAGAEQRKEAEKIQNQIDELEEEQEQDKEIFEWWLVSDWLLKRLEEHGEPVLHTDFGDWWGRCTTGQGIAIDSVIETIYKDLHK